MNHSLRSVRSFVFYWVNFLCMYVVIVYVCMWYMKIFFFCFSSFYTFLRNFFPTKKIFNYKKKKIFLLKKYLHFFVIFLEKEHFLFRFSFTFHSFFSFYKFPPNLPWFLLFFLFQPEKVLLTDFFFRKISKFFQFHFICAWYRPVQTSCVFVLLFGKRISRIKETLRMKNLCS